MTTGTPAYVVSVCGETLPPFPQSPGGVHTHGSGVIHIHPQRPAESGSRASLALFFANADGELTDDSMVLPSGGSYTNGDLCPDGRPGQLVVTAKGDPVGEPSSYGPEDEDVVSISFQAVEQP